MILADNSFLSLVFHPDARPPKHPDTGKPIGRLKEKIDDLLERWRTDKETILIPTPTLSEFLYLAGDDGPLYLAEIDSDPLFKVAGFDQKAAIELAVLNLKVKQTLSKAQQKRNSKNPTKAKENFDKQIVAAIANGVRHIYSDDSGVAKFAAHENINVVRTWDLPEPKMKQMDLADDQGTITPIRKKEKTDEETKTE
jgi:hypothetical protein